MSKEVGHGWVEAREGPCPGVRRRATRTGLSPQAANGRHSPVIGGLKKPSRSLPFNGSDDRWLDLMTHPLGFDYDS